MWWIPTLDLKKTCVMCVAVTDKKERALGHRLDISLAHPLFQEKRYILKTYRKVICRVSRENCTRHCGEEQFPKKQIKIMSSKASKIGKTI